MRSTGLQFMIQSIQDIILPVIVGIVLIINISILTVTPRFG
jgi:hypothetical protein